MCVDFQQLVWFSKNSSRRTGQIDLHWCLALTILFIYAHIVCISFVLSTRMSEKIDVSCVVTTIRTRYFRRAHKKWFAEKRKTIYKLMITYSSHWGSTWTDDCFHSRSECIYDVTPNGGDGGKRFYRQPVQWPPCIVSEIFKKFMFIY